jgi:CRISPR/Cas system-associated exonuclease Cas4 (RecB family)
MAHRVARELRNEFSWSHSRHETFRDCPRRYYYHYYGSWGGWSASAEPQVRRLYVLKNLKARQLWAGGLVHDAVAEALRALRSGASDAEALARDAPAAGDRAVARMRREFRASRDGAYLQRPGREPGLLEHHYREPVPDPAWRALADGVRAAVERFHRGPYLPEFRGLPAEAWLAIEDLASFTLEETTVYARLDLALALPPGGATIVDWKTGRRAPRPEGLQLAAYALYATQRWGLPAESIVVREVNLTSGDEGRGRVDDGQLEDARAEIRESVRRMRARLADANANLAREDDFEPTPGPRPCSGCPFREICPAGVKPLS